ncbi:MAG: hypothetical protein WAN65_01230, partial [Candidatus Sulfotelmatobacter sp.]
MIFDGDDGVPSGSGESESTLDRATAYLDEHPLHGPEPEAKAADGAAAAEKTPEQIAAEAEAAKTGEKTPEQIAADKAKEGEQKTPEQIKAEKD